MIYPIIWLVLHLSTTYPTISLVHPSIIFPKLLPVHVPGLVTAPVSATVLSQVSTLDWLEYFLPCSRIPLNVLLELVNPLRTDDINLMDGLYTKRIRPNDAIITKSSLVQTRWLTQGLYKITWATCCYSNKYT